MNKRDIQSGPQFAFSIFVLRTFPPQKNVELFYEKYEIQDKNTAALDDFTRYCTLGEGAFGRVMMLQNHGDKVFYAVKILRKEKVIEMQQEANCLNEKRVMQVSGRNIRGLE